MSPLARAISTEMRLLMTNTIVPQISTTDRNAEAAYTEYQRQRTEAATYAHQVKQAEARQRRMDEMARKTAEFTGEDDGNILWAA